MLRRLVPNRWFALTDLFLVSLSGCLWALRPEIGILPIISIALLPWVFRSVAGSFPFRRTSLDLPVALFLITAWAGYWAAYDQETAWSKLWMIVLAVLLYYALAGQPRENLAWICFYFFCIGVGVSLYFFLTHDFIVLPRKMRVVNEIGGWIMEIRPSLNWMPIHPNYVGGLAAIMSPFVAYPAFRLMRKRGIKSASFRIFMMVGLGVMLLAIIMATSRGSLMAVASAGGLLIVWWIVTKSGSNLRHSHEIVFPALVTFCLCMIVILLYAGPGQSGGVISANYPYGTSSRAELFTRSLYLVSDFPFTGGGLGAFPGLYSHYILGIPFFNVANSHNLFLDVAIEQGILGGLAFLAIYLVSIWSVSKAIVRSDLPHVHLVGLLTFTGLIIAFLHGMVDDYLYNTDGTVLCLALAGLSSAVSPELARDNSKKSHLAFGIVGMLTILILTNLGMVRSVWYANLGAVQLSRAELIGFPTDQWTPPSLHPELDPAEGSLYSALEVDPANRVGNHRLGLIYMRRGDYLSAAAYLQKAYEATPTHRGIIKSLGYCYVWSGNVEKALVFLRHIPETERELEAYAWWWVLQGRQDLSDNAVELATYLKTQANQ